MARTALVAGASGLVGSHVLHLLLEDPEYQRVTVLARRALPTTHKRLEQRILALDGLAQMADFPRVHDVFCCLGTTMKQAGSPDAFRKVDRSEEHTSELQSPSVISYAVSLDRKSVV